MYKTIFQKLVTFFTRVLKQEVSDLPISFEILLFVFQNFFWVLLMINVCLVAF